MSVPLAVRTSLGPYFGPSEPRTTFSSRYLRFGPFWMDLKREELLKDGARVHIPAKVYQVLLALVERPGEVVTREDLRRRLWPDGTYVNYDANVNTTVNKLRLALGDEAETPQFIETIPRQGYCFLATVEQRDEMEKPAPNAAEPLSAQAGLGIAPIAAQKTVSGRDLAPLEELTRRLPGFLLTGWAAAVLLCGVLIGMGIVLFTHRPS